MAKVSSKRNTVIEVSSVEINKILYQAYVKDFDPGHGQVPPERVKYEFVIDKIKSCGCKVSCRCGGKLVERVTGVKIFWGGLR
jgi:hypothetical protein